MLRELQESDTPSNPDEEGNSYLSDRWVVIRKVILVGGTSGARNARGLTAGPRPMEGVLQQCHYDPAGTWVTDSGIR